MAMVSGAFFLTALIYAMIGFGGGSTYTAILALSETPHSFIPVISLVCNIVVVSGGIWRFSRAGHINLVRALPWIFFSVPAAWLGGMVRLSATYAASSQTVSRSFNNKSINRGFLASLNRTGLLAF